MCEDSFEGVGVCVCTLAKKGNCSICCSPSGLCQAVFLLRLDSLAEWRTESSEENGKPIRNKRCAFTPDPHSPCTKLGSSTTRSLKPLVTQERVRSDEMTLRDPSRSLYPLPTYLPFSARFPCPPCASSTPPFYNDCILFDEMAECNVGSFLVHDGYISPPVPPGRGAGNPSAGLSHLVRVSTNLDTEGAIRRCFLQPEADGRS